MAAASPVVPSEPQLTAPGQALAQNLQPRPSWSQDRIPAMGLCQVTASYAAVGDQNLVRGPPETGLQKADS